MKRTILSVEIGGTKLQLALGSPEGEILDIIRGEVDVNLGGQGIRDWLLNHIPEFINTHEKSGASVRAIACGFGGPLNKHEGRVLRSIQIKGWEGFPIQNWFEEAFGRPTMVENDTNAAAWGEFRKGFGQECQHFFYTNLGSGVGGGFIFNGQLFDGQGFGAGEFGHTYVPDWTSVQPGRPAQIEQLCSGWAIENRLHSPGYLPDDSDLCQRFSGKLSEISCKDLADSGKRGDQFALDEIDRIAQSLGIGLANVINLTNLERIAIGGGVAKMGDLLIDPIRKYTREYVFMSSRDRYEIQRCELGDEIVLIGAILLAKETFMI